MASQKVYIVIPNWNGKTSLKDCLDSLADQSEQSGIIVVDNGSVDGSVEFVEKHYPDVVLVKNKKNQGFAGGVNRGIEWAMELGCNFVALFNNDAVADKEWLKHLVLFMEKYEEAGIATSKISDIKKKHLDSTGEFYTTWGLPYPRGRGEKFSDKYDNDTWVFGASGGATLYRISMLEEIGLFDEDFFAYYEDVDISFRAQLAGWKIGYVPEALCFHMISATSGKIPGFATYHTIKNLPFLFYKNVPRSLMRTIWPRYALALTLVWLSAMAQGHLWAANKAVVVAIFKLPKKFRQRRQIQRYRKVPDSYIAGIITCDLPPNAHRLRALRARWRRLKGQTR